MLPHCSSLFHLDYESQNIPLTLHVSHRNCSASLPSRTRGTRDALYRKYYIYLYTMRVTRLYNIFVQLQFSLDTTDNLCHVNNV